MDSTNNTTTATTLISVDQAILVINDYGEHEITNNDWCLGNSVVAPLYIASGAEQSRSCTPSPSTSRNRAGGALPAAGNHRQPVLSEHPASVLTRSICSLSYPRHLLPWV
ncbi:uncharacterized protein LOC114121655 [Aphis gossypii]|uniref:uncharacterized protein LOC114121655 n=1 Tax=Aphis gossypii TaxID=80765 RepID=UPI00100DC473|nr:uncharacterized protein LOC114121655 [Aphis gossypii]